MSSYRVGKVITEADAILAAYTLCPSNKDNDARRDTGFNTAFEHAKKCDWCERWLERNKEVQDSIPNP